MIRRALRRERDAWLRAHAQLERARAEGVAALGGCRHPAPVPVHAHPTDELVAHLCPDCDAQLPAEWAPIRQSIRVSPEASERDPLLRGPEMGYRPTRSGPDYLPYPCS